MIILYILLAVVMLLLLDLSLRFYYGRKAMRLLENQPLFHVESAVAQKDAVPFELKTKDDLTLRGSIYYPDRMPALGIILFCPETGANHWTAPRYTQGLIDQGYIVISFDFRNQGESDSLPGYESLHWVSEYELADLRSVIAWIREQESLKGLPLGFFGVSRGASAALQTISHYPDIEFMVSDSGYTNNLLISHYWERWSKVIVPAFLFKIYPVAQMRKTLDMVLWVLQFKRNCKYVNGDHSFEEMEGKNIYLIAGAKDSYVPARIHRELKKELGENCADLWIVPQVSHNGARMHDAIEYDSRLVQFFNQMVVPQETAPVLEYESAAATDQLSLN